MIDDSTRITLRRLRAKLARIHAGVKKAEKRKPAAFGEALVLTGTPAQRRKASADATASRTQEWQLTGKAGRR